METFKLCLCFIFIYMSMAEKNNHYTQRKISKTVLKCPPAICSNTSTSFEIVHIEATNILNESDSIHYLYSCINRPTIVLTHVFTKTKLNPIQWDKLLNRSSDAISFDPPVTRISGFVLSKVFAFNDTVDQVDLDGHFKDGTRVQIFNDVLDEFVWSLQDGHISDRATFVGKSGKRNGTLSFQARAFNHSGQADDLPHDPIHANLTQFTISLKDLPDTHSDETHTHLRYALEVIAIRGKKGQEHLINPDYSTTRSLDDEYTPGIFKFFRVLVPVEDVETFLSWKPVSYTSEHRSRASQSFAYNFKNVTKISRDAGYLELMSGDAPWTIADAAVPGTLQHYGVNITFGMTKDGFYKATKYTSWTGLAGSGRPPKEIMSDMVLIVIIVGLGAPAVALLVAVFVLLVRRVGISIRSNSAYDQIN